jgi:hypothetical protein
LKKPRVDILSGGKCGDDAVITIESRSAKGPVFHLQSKGVLVATAEGIGGGRALGRLAMDSGANMVRHDYDLREDET